MKTTYLLPVISLGIFIGGCAENRANQHAVRDASSAIRTGLEACVSKKVVQPLPILMHAELRNGHWHVWEAGRDCEVFSTDVDAASGDAGPCSVCVT